MNDASAPPLTPEVAPLIVIDSNISYEKLRELLYVIDELGPNPGPTAKKDRKGTLEYRRGYAAGHLAGKKQRLKGNA